MSSSGKLEVKLRVANADNYSGTHANITLRCHSAPYDDLPFDGGKRQPGIGGLQIQNIATLWEMNLAIYEFQIDSGDWDDGDDQQLIRYLRAAHIWIESVDEIGWKVQGTLQDGTNYDYFTSSTHTRMPIKVVATWGPATFNIGARNWRKRSVKLTAVLPDVGVTIT